MWQLTDSVMLCSLGESVGAGAAVCAFCECSDQSRARESSSGWSEEPGVPAVSS